METVKGGKQEELDCDVLLVCVGRRPYTAGLGLEVRGGGCEGVCVCVCVCACVCVTYVLFILQNVGITLDERGRVPVDAAFKTSVPK